MVVLWIAVVLLTVLVGLLAMYAKGIAAAVTDFGEFAKAADLALANKLNDQSLIIGEFFQRFNKLEKPPIVTKQPKKKASK